MTRGLPPATLPACRDRGAVVVGHERRGPAHAASRALTKMPHIPNRASKITISDDDGRTWPEIVSSAGVDPSKQGFGARIARFARALSVLPGPIPGPGPREQVGGLHRQ